MTKPNDPLPYISPALNATGSVFNGPARPGKTRYQISNCPAMKYYFLLLCAFLALRLPAQSSFDSTYYFGASTSFGNILAKGDTLIIYGSKWNPALEQWGGLLLKVDTTGTVLDMYEYYDEEGEQYAFVAEKRHPIVAMSDGGWLLAGGVFGTSQNYYLRVNSRGEVLYKRYHTNPIGVGYFYPSILRERNDTVYFAGTSINVGTTNADLTYGALDSTGDLLWLQTIPNPPGGSLVVRSLVILNSNNLLLAATRSTFGFVANSGSTDAHFFLTDSLGQVLDEWEVESEGREFYLTDFQMTPDSGWIYLTSDYEYVAQYNDGMAPKIKRLDKNFEVLWETQLLPSYSQITTLNGLERGPDGHWIVAAQAGMPPSLPTSFPPDAYWAGCLFKVSDAGELLWSRTDTTRSLPWSRLNSYGGMTMLSDGSIYSAGDLLSTASGTNQSYGWLTKVTPDGCLGTPCGAITSVHTVPSDRDTAFELWPNPTADKVTIRLGEPDFFRYELLDLSGKVLRRSERMYGQGRCYLGTYASGLYYLRVLTSTGSSVRKVVRR